MPELPEVETVRRGLAKVAVGHRVDRVEVTGRRSVRRQSSEEFAGSLASRQLVEAGRFGKYLVVALDDGASLVIHLRMSGQLLYVVDRAEPMARHTHIVLGLEDGSELRFVDPRTFGEMFISATLDERGRPAELAGLGVDPLVDGLDAKDLAGLLGRRRTSLKAFLLDQRHVAGIGSLYADEICFRARLAPHRRAESLRPGEVRRLAAAIAEVLAEAIELRGSSLRDASYRDLMGDYGGFQAHHAVYDRAGEPCLACGKLVTRTRIAGRSAHFCSRCQA